MESDLTAQSRIGPADPQVMVVGAGPTGLLLAAELERRGVTCLLIDEGDAPRGWDRATVIHPRSLEIFEAIGVVDRLLAEGVKVRGARFRSDGQTLGELNLGAVASSYGFDIGISEEMTESVLIDYLGEQGGSVTRSTRLVGLRRVPEGVTAEIDRNGRRSQVSVA
jgi:2-polyprenyl-6-methoxyphenol hydroxylase-like FAD-dependent oxidoreductase